MVAPERRVADHEGNNRVIGDRDGGFFWCFGDGTPPGRRRNPSPERRTRINYNCNNIASQSSYLVPRTNSALPSSREAKEVAVRPLHRVPSRVSLPSPPNLANKIMAFQPGSYRVPSMVASAIT